MAGVGFANVNSATVAADASAGLKANTKYSVVVAYKMDGPFPAIHTDDLSFSIYGPAVN